MPRVRKQRVTDAWIEDRVFWVINPDMTAEFVRCRCRDGEDGRRPCRNVIFRFCASPESAPDEPSEPHLGGLLLDGQLPALIGPIN